MTAARTKILGKRAFIEFSVGWGAQRTRASAAWPATRNGNALATRRRRGPRPPQALVGRLRPAHANVMGGLPNLDEAKTCVEVRRARVGFQNGEFDTRLC